MSVTGDGDDAVLGIRFTVPTQDDALPAGAKAAVEALTQLDLGGADWLVMDVRSHLTGIANMAIGLSTAPDWAYTESAPMQIRPGDNPDVAFDLRSSNFKCAATGWRHEATFAPTTAVNKVTLLVYPQVATGRVEILSLRVAASP